MMISHSFQDNSQRNNRLRRRCSSPHSL